MQAEIEKETEQSVKQASVDTEHDQCSRWREFLERASDE
jgi:hypothetical protein